MLILKLSTRGRYGLKAVYELALHYGDGPTSLKDIASSQNLSESYLEQLFLSLRKEEIIDSVRGAQGGYMLAREPKEITVGQILRCLEGDMSPSACLLDDSDCSNKEECITKYVWSEIKDSVDRVIDSITLENMLEKRSTKLEEVSHE